MKLIFRRKVKNKLQPVREADLVATQRQLVKLVGQHTLIYKGIDPRIGWATWLVKVNGRVIGHLHEWIITRNPHAEIFQQFMYPKLPRRRNWPKVISHE